MTDTFNVEKFNGIEITTHLAGRFNASALFNKYQPKNKNIKRYLQSGKFAEQFSLTLRALPDSPRNGDSSNPTPFALSVQNFQQSMSDIKTGPNRNRGLYVSREYLHPLLTLINPNYRATGSAAMEAMNRLNHGEAPVIAELAIINKRTRAVEDLDPDSYAWRAAMCADVEDPIERERLWKSLDNKMW
jgi:hypothetical protein